MVWSSKYLRMGSTRLFFGRSTCNNVLVGVKIESCDFVRVAFVRFEGSRKSLEEFIELPLKPRCSFIHYHQGYFYVRTPRRKFRARDTVQLREKLWTLLRDVDRVMLHRDAPNSPSPS